ncbi:SusC/RagA family TonB-linked outer membrane protein [Fodinibius salsisoli]|uniref:TonB-dependent receptor n=1 Tax=Fodinibius salsisoli TaxID=2820877 RepID=A0ABT3PKK0_9BACT|nr:TonB-dependent receptor [Fodinibius salsisoli]MCW9706476.1 TonB-dependent receptor [Fodinibius salsisoli]
MKRLILFFILCGIVGQMPTKAQDLGEVLTLQRNNVNLQEVIPLKEQLDLIEKEYQTTFIYKSHLVEQKFVKRQKPRDKKLATVLRNLLDPLYLKFEQIGNKNFIILPAEKPEPQLDEEISGIVTDASNGETLPGVNIMVKGTTKGTTTGSNGEFNLMVPTLQDTLVFSFVGFQTREVPIAGRNSLEVDLQAQAVTGDEVVVVGYGTQERADLTSSISTVDVEKTLESRPITDLARGLQGSVAGLTVTNATGEIGTNSSITLRGLQGSLNSPGGASPLILVDGVEVESLNQINPENIESISVLKDAASTAIYGSRAAWGAVLIKTKLGDKNSVPQINYSNSFSFATPTNDLNLAPAAEGTEMAFNALQRSNPSTNVFGVVGMYFDETAIQKMREWEEQYGDQNLSDEMVMGRDFEIRDGRLFFYRPWDAGDKFMKEWTPMQKHNLGVSGGTEATTYNIGLGYLGQEGVLDISNDKWQRYNVDIGLQADVNNWLDARGKFMFAQTERTRPYTNYGAIYDSWYYLYRWPRTYPYGTYEGRPFRSAVTGIKQASESLYTSSLSRITVGGTATLTEGLTIDTDFTYNRKEDHLDQTGGNIQGYNFWAGGGNLNYGTYSSPTFNNVNYTSDWTRRSNLRAVATYENDLDEHSVKILAGGEAEQFDFTSQYSERQGLLDPSKGEIDLANGDQFVNGARTNWSTVGFFGRINYSFEDTYLLQLNARYDGSSRFPSNQRWGFFPSVSAGYKISEESFMDFSKPALTFLKLRASYGSVGNNAVGAYPYIATMGSYGSDWLISGSEDEVTFGTPGAVSTSLTWETVTTLDFGFDARFFEDQLNLTFDWYDRTTSDMLSAGITLPSTFGTGSPRRNYGELQTRGWELEIGWNHSFENEGYLNLTGTLSNFTEEITKYANTTQGIGSYRTGRILGEIWGYETDRLFTRDDFQQDASGNLLTDEDGEYLLKEGIPDQSLLEDGSFSFGPGDVKFKDLNGDGKITYGSNTVDDPGDQKVIGNSTPKFQYGLRIGGGWKGFDLSVFLQGVGKREFWANGPVFVPGYRPWEGWFENQLDYWTPENKDAFYPRPTNQLQSSYTRNFRPQTRYILDMSYFRMKNITIGYTLPKSITSKVKIGSLRVYVSGENLFEFDNVNVPLDPETNYTDTGRAGSFGRVYPFQRVISAGLNMKF